MNTVLDSFKEHWLTTGIFALVLSVALLNGFLLGFLGLKPADTDQARGDHMVTEFFIFASVLGLVLVGASVEPKWAVWIAGLTAALIEFCLDAIRKRQVRRETVFKGVH